MYPNIQRLSPNIPRMAGSGLSSSRSHLSIPPARRLPRKQPSVPQSRVKVGRWSIRVWNIGSESGPEGYTQDMFEERVETLGLDVTTFTDCFTSPKTEADVQAVIDEALEMGINGVPALLVNGKSIPLAEDMYDVLVKEIEESLEEATFSLSRRGRQAQARYHLPRIADRAILADAMRQALVMPSAFCRLIPRQKEIFLLVTLLDIRLVLQNHRRAWTRRHGMFIALFSLPFRVVAIDSKGDILASESYTNNTHPDPFYPSYRIWDANEIWNKMCMACRKVLFTDK